MGEEVDFIDLREIVVSTTDQNQHLGNHMKMKQDPATMEQAYIFSMDQRDQIWKKLHLANSNRCLPASGLAIAGGAKTKTGLSPLNRKVSLLTDYWVRPGQTLNSRDALVKSVKEKNEFSPDINGDDMQIGIAPVMNFDIEKILAFQKRLPGLIKIDAVKDYLGKVLYHTIQVGSWPERIASGSKELEWLYKNERGRFIPTGKKFADVELGFTRENEWGHSHDEFIINDGNREFEFEGKYYVRAKDHTANKDQNEYVWLEERLKSWIIINYENLPKSLNPRGKGKAQTMEVWSGSVMRSDLPYYQKKQALETAKIDVQKLSYQDSMVYQYLNGVGAFCECNFLSEALVVPAGLCLTRETNSVKSKKLHPIFLSEGLKKLHELNHKMVRNSIQLKHPEMDLAQFCEDLDKVIGYVDEVQDQINKERDL